MSITKAALVHSASELQRLLFSNRRLLREAVESGGLTLDLRLRFDDQYAKLLDARDRKILAMGIDREPDPFAEIFARPLDKPRHDEQEDAEPADQPPAGRDGDKPGDREGVGHDN
ncbi:MAG TPA: hypothetical protein VGN57_14115 [Pirellulaceae bacterium]|nr:hypothetical protein [Pirellulaceae bacterium]